MAIPCPSLSLSGWVTNAAEKADVLISHFYESNKSQTYIYGSSVSSLQWIIEQYGHDITNVCQQLRYGLENYLNRYYDSVTVEVTASDNDDNLTGSIGLKIYSKVVDGGVEYSFGKLLTITNSKISTIISLNNDGA